MKVNRISLKESASAKVASAKPTTTLPTLGYLVIAAVLSSIQVRLEERFDVWYNSLRSYLLDMGPYPVFNFTNVLAFSALFIILLSLISSIFSTGYTWYALKINRSLRATFTDIFDPLNVLFKYIGLAVVIAVFSFLWSLLFVIPGIVAGYSYRQAFYILYDHPEYSILDCIRESKKMMRGHKGELFVLDLSFLGWHIVCALTLGILYIWKLPYIEVTYAGFYDAIGGNASREPEQRDPNKFPWE